MPNEAERIAKGLTEAQRQQIDRDAVGGNFTMATARELTRKGLFEFRAESPNGRCGPCRITPLGLEVRSILQGEQP